MRPTIVLVHGAFAESSSWDQVIDRLLDAVFVDAEVRGRKSLQAAPARALDDRDVERDEVGLDAHDRRYAVRRGGGHSGPDLLLPTGSVLEVEQ